MRPLMEIFWLRPETAAWRSCDCLALHEVEFTGPIADVGCGDGLFSFTRAGGRLNSAYDMFSTVNELEEFFDKVDIYDHFDENTTIPIVTEKPLYDIDVGVDQKLSLLKKAYSLGFYNEVRPADANESLPLEDGRFYTIYSNIVYWLDNYRNTLREMRRALAEDGQIILQLPNITMRDYSFFQRLYVRTGDPSWEWLHLIDRGRSDNIRQCKTYAEWKEIFSDEGLRIVHHRNYLSKNILEAWDIGLRPISPFLIEMANGLPPEKRLDIKERWVEAYDASGVSILLDGEFH
ncbi:SAM-dependent methyltransferase [Azospirillum agricola]|uniref:class I SAM-dependent methyltransferase n=1 Tax=Azospirillum agricola TaxID=1720247 RepID=UPI001AE867DA|nr:methyltransferase domain-containing protein [Azospirillum agricola]MBP2233300.1 SAM-dependent methyltransferase [Azospirillum agricola]